MALIKCKECNKDISSTTFTCPQCGFVLKNTVFQKIGTGLIAVFKIIFFLFLLSFLYVSCSKSSPSPEIKSQQDSLLKIRSQQEQLLKTLKTLADTE